MRQRRVEHRGQPAPITAWIVCDASQLQADNRRFCNDLEGSGKDLTKCGRRYVFHGRFCDAPLNALRKALAISSMHFFPAARSPAIKKNPWIISG